MFLASAAVHDTGFNLQSLGVIVGSFGLFIIALAGFVDRRMQGNRKSTEDRIVTEVEKITSPLIATLNAMTDNLNRVNNHLREQDERIIKQGENIAEIRGQLQIRKEN